MRVKVEVYLDIDIQKNNKFRRRFEEIIRERKAKIKDSWDSNRRYRLFVYEDDPLYNEIISLKNELLDGVRRRTKAISEGWDHKKYWELYNANCKRLESMQDKGISEEEIFTALVPYWEEMTEILHQENARTNLCYEPMPGCTIYIMDYFPEYTEDEEKEIAGYLISGSFQCPEIEKKEKFLKRCDECKRYVEQIGPCILKRSQTLKKYSNVKKVFESEGDLFVTLPMYEYLMKNGVAAEYFCPAYMGVKGSELVGYQIITKNILPAGSYTDGRITGGEVCSICGKQKMEWVSGDTNSDYDKYFHNWYVDFEKIEKWEDINLARREFDLEHHELVFSPKMCKLLKEADPKIIIYPVFPLAFKEHLGS